MKVLTYLTEQYKNVSSSSNINDDTYAKTFDGRCDCIQRGGFGELVESILNLAIIEFPFDG